MSKNPIEEFTEEMMGKDNNPGKEALMSANVRGYYKGYGIQLTARDENVNLHPLLEEFMAVVDWMVENGFKPSWNEETNAKIPAKDKATCPHTNTEIKEAGPKSKHPGRKYEYCKDCGSWLRWADYK